MFRRFFLAAFAAIALLLHALPADAAVTAVTGDSAGATAIATAIASDPTQVTSASFVAVPSGTPNGVSDTPLGSFPTSGPTYGILTSGDVTDVPNTNFFANTELGGPSVRGNTDADVTILKVDLNVPSGANCLTFDFKFLSTEYPGFVNSAFNDAFIAELDTSTWTTSGSTISAPNNFAFDSSGEVVSINSTGLGGMSAAEGAGTAFNGAQTYAANGFPLPGNAGGATVLLSASTSVTPGAHSVYFSILDQGDQRLDSAVFLDNLTVGFVPNPAVNCVAGAQPVSFSMTLTPPTATNEVGTSHTVSATLNDSSGAPVPNATVAFATTGANSASGTATTDGSGTATFTYTGTAAGNDIISATYDADGDGVFEVTASATKTWEITNNPPDCSAATVDRATLWPPNHRMRSVAISGVTDPDAGDSATINVTGVTQDEPTNGLGDGDTAVDAGVTPNSDVVQLRAERAGGGDGRVYVITFTATDAQGATCTGTVTVSVPHDQKPGHAAVDSGQNHNSLV